MCFKIFHHAKYIHAKCCGGSIHNLVNLHLLKTTQASSTYTPTRLNHIDVLVDLFRTLNWYILNAKLIGTKVLQMS